MNDLFGARDSGREDRRAIPPRTSRSWRGWSRCGAGPACISAAPTRRALHHLAAEILDNAMDEAVAGHASFIEVTLEPDNWLTVRDNGRGIPGRSASQVQEISAPRGHPDDAAFGRQVRRQGLRDLGRPARRRQFGGQCAVGRRWRSRSRATACCGSRAMRAASRLTKLINAGPVHNRRGTSIRFQPDPKIFGAVAVQPGAAVPAVPLEGLSVPRRRDPLELRPRAAAARQGRRRRPRRVLHFPGGLRDILEAEIGETARVLPQLWAGEADLPASAEARPAASNGRSPGWRSEDGFLHSYCNTIPTPQGGTHEAGLPRGAAEGPARLGRAARQPARGAGRPPTTCSAPIAAKLSVFLREPQFQGQTKEKLTSAEATRLVETALRDHFDHWLAGDPTQADNLLAFVIERAEERLRRQREQGHRRARSATRKLRLPGKLADCTRENAARDRDLPGRGRQRRRLGQAGAQPRDPGGAAAARQDPERGQRLGRQAAAEPGAQGSDRGAGLRRRRPLRPRRSCATSASSS